MKYLNQSQPRFLLWVITFSCIGGIVVISPEVAAKPTKTHIVRGHAQRKGHVKARPFVHNLQAKAAPVDSISRTGGAGAAPFNFTPQQWQDYGEMMRRESSSGDLVKQGDADANLGNWTQAAAQDKDALNLWSGNPDGLYGMGQCAAAAGDLPRAISYYRTAVYVPSPNTLNVFGTVPGDGFQTNDVKRLMEFALLLDKTGQVPEALFIYNRAAALMDYERGDVQHGDQNVKVLLPGLALEPASANLVQYTPERLRALADTALAYKETSFGSNKEAVAHMQEAVKLFPDSPVTHYYLGEVSLRANDPGAKAAYQKAIELGDDQTVAAAKERLTQLP